MISTGIIALELLTLSVRPRTDEQHVQASTYFSLWKISPKHLFKSSLKMQGSVSTAPLSPGGTDLRQLG